MRACFPPASFDFTRNGEALVEFYRLQGEMALSLALRPQAILRWLERQRVPRRAPRTRAPREQTARWRTARLSGVRQRELRALLAQDSIELPGWLLASLPACTLLDIDDADTKGATGVIARSMLRLRDELLRANLGLAKAAASRSGGRPHEFDDRLSAACSGLLDAIDRYVPGPGSARFAYFAAYWIRYHIARYVQKNCCIVTYPIHQQRTRLRGGPGCAERPIVVGLVDDVDGSDLLLNEAAPDPCDEGEADEVAVRIQRWLKQSVPPATRVMLAAVHSVGALSEAASDYVQHLSEIARTRLLDLADIAPLKTVASDRGRD